MRFRALIVGVCAVAFAAVGTAQETVVAPIDVLHEESIGAATITASPWDIGSPQAVFDGTNGTLYRSASVNPAEITVVFDSEQTFERFQVMGAGGTNRYRVAVADNVADLDSQSGSYTLMIDWTTVPNETLQTLTPAAPAPGRAIRLITNRISGDNFVHIRRWEIEGRFTVTGVNLVPQHITLAPGRTQQFEAFGQVGGGSTVNITPEVAWSTLNPDIVTIDPDGIATAVGEGVGRVRAQLGPLANVAFVTVQEEPVDLNVRYISRTPRYNYDASKNQPDPGDTVTFTAYVRNWGTETLDEVDYVWKIDGAVVEEGVISPFAGDSEEELSIQWAWQDGDHTVTFTIDPENKIDEFTTANNSITDRTNAIIAGFWVEQSMYDFFQRRQRDLGIGSNSWDDWIQRQMSKMNELLEGAVYDETPDGVLDRVRIDKIVVVPDGSLPLSGGLPTNNPDLSDRTVDLMWGFVSAQLDTTFYSNTTSVNENNPFYIERSLIHELGHARYLVDNYGFDVHNTFNPNTGTGHDSVQIIENGEPIAGTDLMPYVAFGEVLYYNRLGGVMGGPYYGFNWSPHEAMALNLVAGQRARCGNYNAPCDIGIYLQDIPENNHVRFVDGEGRPLAGADIRVYQADPGPGWYGMTFDNNPDLFFTADCQGRVNMGSNPFAPDGTIRHTFGHANGVVILRIEHDSGLWYEFMEVTKFNMAYWQGHTEHAEYEVVLDGARGGTPDLAEPFGTLDIFDVLEFLSLFEDEQPGADLAPPFDVWDIFDVLEFLELFEAGCP